MATETRHLVLSSAEFTFSLQSFRRTHEDFLPAGDIVDWSPSGENALEISMEIKGGSTTNQMTFTIEEDQVIAILIRFCMENNIPVPRAGIRKWSMRDTSIMLSIALTGNELERANIDMAALA